MTMTPDSTPVNSPYLSPADLLNRYDSRLIAQLLSDTGTPVDDGDIAMDANLLAIIADACGMLESAALVGGRYRPQDLQALIAANVVGSNYVKRLVSDITMGMLRARRGMREDQPFPAYTDAMAQLELIREGEIIFPFLEVEDAGLTHQTQMTTQNFYKQGRLTTLFPRFWGRRIDQETNTTDNF